MWCASGRRRPPPPGRPARKRTRGLGRLRTGHRRRAHRGAGPQGGRRPVGWTDGRGHVRAHSGGFPVRRLRRLRRTPALRRLVAEARLGPTTWLLRSFVREGATEPVPIASMPGQVQHSLESLVLQAKSLVALGIPGLILFGVRRARTPRAVAPGPPGRGAGGAACRARRGGRRARADGGPLSRRVHRSRALRHPRPRGEVLNDPTLELYQRIALAQAEAGRTCGTQRHDGRPGGCHPCALDRRRPRSGGHPRLRLQVRLRALRPFRDAVDVSIAGGGDRRPISRTHATGAQRWPN